MRKVYAIGGSDRVEFLQGLVTNDVGKLTHGLVYAALLTPQGKYIADFFLKDDGERILIDLPGEIADTTIKRLSMYRLRADVTIDATDLIVSTGKTAAPEGAEADPRHPDMGWRFYGSKDVSDDTDWDALRTEFIVPEYGSELGPDSFILEMGFERLNGVDFRKGCYVGQEVTARMKHKTELRKGLASVSITGNAASGEAIEGKGKAVGTVHTISGTKAIAYLRFDRATGPLSAGEAKITGVKLPE